MNDLHLFDSDFEDLYDMENFLRPNCRVFRGRRNYLSLLSNLEFYDRFRMSKESFCILYNEMQRFFEPELSRYA